MKTCTRCLSQKGEEEFYWQYKDIRRFAICKKCKIQNVLEKRLIVGSKEYFSSKHNKKKRQAKERGIIFNLSIDEFASVYRHNSCHYCKVFLENKKTIDRIDPTQGYCVDNIVLSCHRCNRLKSSYKISDIPYLREILKTLTKKAKATPQA